MESWDFEFILLIFYSTSIIVKNYVFALMLVDDYAIISPAINSNRNTAKKEN